MLAISSSPAWKQGTVHFIVHLPFPQLRTASTAGTTEMMGRDSSGSAGGDPFSTLEVL